MPKKAIKRKPYNSSLDSSFNAASSDKTCSDNNLQ